MARRSIGFDQLRYTNSGEDANGPWRHYSGDALNERHAEIDHAGQRGPDNGRLGSLCLDAQEAQPCAEYAFPSRPALLRGVTPAIVGHLLPHTTALVNDGSRMPPPVVQCIERVCRAHVRRLRLEQAPALGRACRTARGSR
jgi:hypothetical protein